MMRLSRKFTIIMLMGLLLVLGIAKTAKADPHGIFYTAIGQKQLFFNVLAALNQADYVETEFLRGQLLEAREAVDAEPKFEDEEFPLTEETKIGTGTASSSDPGVADLITRSITLEGTDLYNDQLVRLFGAEFGRRNSTSELVRALCEYGLGILQCDEDLLSGLSETEREALEEQVLGKGNRAFINNPVEWSSLPYTNGALAASESGKEEPIWDATNTTIIGWDPVDANKRIEMLNDNEAPYAYSELIGKWRQDAKTSGDPETQNESLQGLIDDALRDFQGIDSGIKNPYSMTQYNTSTNASEYYDYNCPSCETTTEDLRDLATGIRATSMLIRGELMAAATRVGAQTSIMEDEGMLGDIKAVRAIDEETQIATEEIRVQIDKPVAVREADVYSLPIALALLDTSQRASSLAGLDKPGDKQLVDRPLTSTGTTSGVIDRQVLGAIDVFGGTIDPLFTGYVFDYDVGREPTSPSANIISGHLEQGAVHALMAITNGRFRGYMAAPALPACGTSCP